MGGRLPPNCETMVVSPVCVAIVVPLFHPPNCETIVELPTCCAMVVPLPPPVKMIGCGALGCGGGAGGASTMMGTGMMMGGPPDTIIGGLSWANCGLGAMRTGCRAGSCPFCKARARFSL